MSTPVEASVGAEDKDAASTPAVKPPTPEEIEAEKLTIRVQKTMECFISDDSGLPAISVDEVG